MAALVRARVPREIVVEMRVARAGNVAALVRGAPRGRVRQRESAVHDEPIGPAEVARQSIDVDERTECHRAIVASAERRRPDAKILGANLVEEPLLCQTSWSPSSASWITTCACASSPTGPAWRRRD